MSRKKTSEELEELAKKGKNRQRNIDSWRHIKEKKNKTEETKSCYLL